MLKPILAIGIGSAIGGITRWGLSVKFNHLSSLPLGTLVANLLAGYIIGLAIAICSNIPTLSPEWRLFIITGFCGGLSTFSTFSSEIILFFQKGQITLGLSTIAVHLMGSLFMTYLGLMTYQWLK